MIIKNKSKYSTTKIVKLVEFVITQFYYLENKETEIHIKNYYGNPEFGISIINCRDNYRYKKYSNLLDKDSKHIVVVWIGKKAYESYGSWEEYFIAILAHELKHIWYAAQINFHTEESECIKMEDKILKRYRSEYGNKTNNRKTKI